MCRRIQRTQHREHDTGNETAARDDRKLCRRQQPPRLATIYRKALAIASQHAHTYTEGRPDCAFQRTLYQKQFQHKHVQCAQALHGADLTKTFCHTHQHRVHNAHETNQHGQPNHPVGLYALVPIARLTDDTILGELFDQPLRCV